jgi:hypothetical protein
MQRILLLLFIVLVSACSSGKKQLAKGNYEASIELAVNRLRNSPGNRRAEEALKEAYTLVKRMHLGKIDQLKVSTEPFKWDQIASSYDELNRIYENVERCPACMKALPKITSYRNEFNEAAMLAADERYDAGIMELAKGTRESAILAYRHFERVDYLKPNYRDTQEKMFEARDLATIRVLVDQIPVHSRRFGLSHEFFQNQLNVLLHSERLSDFVQFYSPSEADRVGLDRPDHVVVMQFDDFVVGQTLIKESTQTLIQDSVVVGQVDIDGKKKDVYGTVEAEYTVFSKFVNSGGLLDMRIIDLQTDRILFQMKMPGEYRWVTEWASYKGDKRALTDEELAMTRNREMPSPDPQFLFEQFCQPIYRQAVDNLRRFYRDY